MLRNGELVLREEKALVSYSTAEFQLVEGNT
jgi:hypothetical protein